MSFRIGKEDEQVQLCKAEYPPSQVLKLLEILKLQTNGFMSIGKQDTVTALWKYIKAIIHSSKSDAFVDLVSLKQYRSTYTVADPRTSFAAKTTFKLKEGSTSLHLQRKHIGTQRAYYDLSRSPEFHNAPVISTENWISIAQWLSLAMEDADIVELSAAPFLNELDPAQTAAYWNMIAARNGNKSAFS